MRTANTGAFPVEEAMARRRYQDPAPERRGGWWTLRVYKDEFAEGKRRRSRKRVRLARIDTTNERDARRMASEYLRPLNQGLETIISAATFGHFIENAYLPQMRPLMATTTYHRSKGILDRYLLPAFGGMRLRDLTRSTLQGYFSKLVTTPEGKPLEFESRDKVRDVLSSTLRYAVDNDWLVKNSAEGVRVIPDRRGRKRSKPYLMPQQFDQLVELIPEPYATMVYVAIYTGLRVSELAGLRWNDVGADTITIDERYCRGDWGAPKSESSNATIPVNRCVIERIHRMKLLTVETRAGNSIRKLKVVKVDGPDDLVFQSVRDGKPVRDNNILSRFLKPAARTMGLPWVNWRALRTSHAVWLKLAGADVKDAQGQMRHSRASTTLDIYQQFVPESQRQVVSKLNSIGRVQ